MPELPEVEYVMRQLREELPGRTLVEAHVEWPRAIAGVDAGEFAGRVVGRRVERLDRRGKYLLVALEGGDVLAIHRRMSGNLLLVARGEPVPYARVRLALDDGRDLVFSDPRKFGRVALLPEGDLATAFGALGPEPLDAAFTPAALAARLAGRQRAVKSLLLDQGVVAGLGNIYADEALFRAGIHPLRAGGSLTTDEVAALHTGIQGALRTGIEHGGTTFGRHRDVHNEAGTNLEHVAVYRRAGQPCRHCGTPLRRIVVAQRGTHFCPRCQPPADAPAVAGSRARLGAAGAGRVTGSG